MYMHVKLKKARQMPKSPSKLDLNGTGYCASFNFRRTARAITKNQPVSIGALADLLVIDSTTLTRSLRLLQKEGLIAISNRAAMRQRFLTITDKGEHALARSLPAWRKAQERFVAKIGPGHWVELRNELERLAHVAVDLEKPKKEAAALTPSGS